MILYCCFGLFAFFKSCHFSLVNCSMTASSRNAFEILFALHMSVSYCAPQCKRSKMSSSHRTWNTRIKQFIGVNTRHIHPLRHITTVGRYCWISFLRLDKNGTLTPASPQIAYGPWNFMHCVIEDHQFHVYSTSAAHWWPVIRKRRCCPQINFWLFQFGNCIFRFSVCLIRFQR